MTKQRTFVRVCITTSDYRQAALERQNGNLDANPLGIALAAHSFFELTSLVGDRVAVRDRRTNATLTASLSFHLAEFMTRFQQGAPALYDRDADLMLLGDDV